MSSLCLETMENEELENVDSKIILLIFFPIHINILVHRCGLVIDSFSRKTKVCIVTLKNKNNNCHQLLLIKRIVFLDHN